MSTTTATTSPLLYGYLGGGHQSNRVESVLGMSTPRVILSMIYHTVTVVIAIIVILLSTTETPAVPLRAWIVVYAIMCLLTMLFQVIEYHRLSQIGAQSTDTCSMAAIMMTVMGIFLVVWWVIGYNWISSGGKVLEEDAPHLYWFTAIFLGVEALLFVVFVLMACIKGIFAR